jgi:long-chain acyl-CoA synthetase
MQIENCLTLSSQWIAQAVALGAGEHFVGALIFPNFKALEHWASKRGKPLPEDWDLSLDKDVRELIAKEIADNMADVQPKYMQAKAFVIVPKVLSIDENELTPTLKVVRHHVLEKYQELISAIYRPSKHPDKICYVVRLPGGTHAVSKKAS